MEGNTNMDLREIVPSSYHILPHQDGGHWQDVVNTVMNPASLCCLFSVPKLCLPPASRWFLASTLRMESKYFSETSVDFQRTTRRYIPEEYSLTFILLITNIIIRVEFY
jgi:hypothetical protein